MINRCLVASRQLVPLMVSDFIDTSVSFLLSLYLQILVMPTVWSVIMAVSLSSSNLTFSITTGLFVYHM